MECHRTRLGGRGGGPVHLTGDGVHDVTDRARLLERLLLLLPLHGVRGVVRVRVLRLLLLLALLVDGEVSVDVAGRTGRGRGRGARRELRQRLLLLLLRLLRLLLLLPLLWLVVVRLVGKSPYLGGPRTSR